MSPNREQHDSIEAPLNSILVAETLRDSVPNRAARKPKKKPTDAEERVSVFWRIFGGTLLSIAALVVLTICQHFNNVLNELRGDLGRLNDELRKDMSHLDADLRKDLGRLNEVQGEGVKKEEFNSRLKSVWDGMKEVQVLSTAVTALKERDMIREQHLREENDRKELVRELQLLRERLANLEGKQAGGNPAPKTPAGKGE